MLNILKTFKEKQNILMCVDIQNTFLNKKFQKLLKIISDNNFKVVSFYHSDNTDYFDIDSKDFELVFTIVGNKCCKSQTIIFNKDADRTQLEQVKFAFKTFDFSCVSFPHFHGDVIQSIFDFYIDNYSYYCNNIELLKFFGINELKHPKDLFGDLLFN